MHTFGHRQRLAQFFWSTTSAIGIGCTIMLPPTSGCNATDSDSLSGDSSSPTLNSGIVTEGDALVTSTGSDQASPSVIFTAGRTFCCSPLDFEFAAELPENSSSMATSFHWDFGDGVTTVGQEVQHSYAWPGNYRVVLTVGFAGGAELESERTVSVGIEENDGGGVTDVPDGDQDNPDPNPDGRNGAEQTESLNVDAGPDQVVASGALVVLSGRIAGTTETPKYTWSQRAGSAVELIGADTSSASFQAPANASDAPFVSEFELTATTTDAVASDTVFVTVLPVEQGAPLTVDAGSDQTVSGGDQVSLIPNVGGAGVQSQYAWTQLSGPSAALTGADTPIARFTAPINDGDIIMTLMFELSVSKGDSVATDTVAVQVEVQTLADRLRDPDAVARVLAGLEPEANAAWWGFEATDSTVALQSAIDSGAETVVVPDMGEPWIVNPMTLASDQTLLFEPGVVVMAKEGSFHGTLDALFFGLEVSNVQIEGHGAVFRMRKDDYTGRSYSKSEHRHALTLRGVDNVTVAGLRLERSGGDGIYLGPTRDSRRVPCSNVQILDCTCDDNYRQGMSITSAVNVLVDGCVMSRTFGTSPKAGLDIEPNDERDSLIDVRVANSRAVDNAGTGFMLNLSHLEATSAPVGVTFENCVVTGSHQPGVRVLLNENNGPNGLVEFINCDAEDIDYSGALFAWYTTSPFQVRFTDCVWSNVARAALELPLNFTMRPRATPDEPGGIEFVNCIVYDDRARDALRILDLDGQPGQSVYNISGDITVINSLGCAPSNLGAIAPDLTVHCVDAPG